MKLRLRVSHTVVQGVIWLRNFGQVNGLSSISQQDDYYVSHPENNPTSNNKCLRYGISGIGLVITGS